MLKDRPTTLWTVRTSEGRWVECVIRFVPVGVEVEIVSDGWSLYSRIFSAGHDALIFAEEERTQLQSLSTTQ